MPKTEKPRQKPLPPTSIKFTESQKVFLKQLSLAQQHGRIGTTVKRLVDKEMKRLS